MEHGKTATTLQLRGGSKALRVLLSVILVVGLMPSLSFATSGTAYASEMETSALSTDTSWYNTTDASFTLSSAAQLAGLAAIVNGTASGISQDSFKGKTITLAGDIDLSSVCSATAGSWVPIGNATYKYSASAASTGYLTQTGYAFLGTFDGAGKTISNLYISSANGYLGLFGAVGGTDSPGAAGYGTVKNFTLTGSVTCTSATAQATDYVAAVCGLLNPGGTICDVVNKANVTASNTMNVGGIVGFTGRGYDTGGASNMSVAEANPSGENTYVLRCGNEGSITGYYKAGGIVGENACIVKYCYNTGTIQQVMSGSGGGIGGIAGRNGNRDNADNCEVGTIMYCYNAGTIKGTNPSGTTIRGFGGITGWNNIISKVQHNYAAGVVEAGYSDYQAVVGRVDNGSGICDNYALDTLNDKYYSTDVDKLKAGIKKTSAELKVQTYNDGDILTLLGSCFVADTTSINGGYPVLWWQNGSTVPAVQSLAITTAPTKTEYSAGEVFDSTGMVMKATYADGTTHVISASDCAYKTDALTTADTAITFSYTEGGTTVTATQAITVNASVLTSLVVKTKPTYTVYAANESFDATGMAITASYNDGAVTKALASGEYTVTEDRANGKVVVSYTDGGVTKTVDVAITFLASDAPSLVSSMYELDSADDLVWFAAQVDQRGSVAISAKLTADIDLSGVAYLPIGNASTKAFTGTLDGNGKTITYSTGTTFAATSYLGVVGYLGAKGVVKNLTTEGSVKLTGSNSAPIVGYIYGASAKVTDCTNNASVTATAGTIGGIVGNAYGASGTISGCENNGAITSSSSNVGGIVGSTNANTVSVSNCTNNAAVTGTLNVGGIGGTGKAGIASCANHGAVTATTAATGVAGGIIGNNTNTSLTAGIVSACANTGAVKGGKAGGIAGATYKSAYENCYNTGAVTGSGTSATAAGSGGFLGAYTANNAGATFTNCYSTGTVTGKVNANALIGYDIKGATLSNCYYLSGVATNVWGGSAAKTTGFTAKSADDMKAAAFVTALGTAFKADGDGATYESVNGGYPVLSWQELPEVPAATLASIAVTAAPAKTAYWAGESFDAAGMEVTATYSDQSTRVLSSDEYTVEPAGALAAGVTAVTVSYAEGGLTATAEQAVTVTQAAAQVGGAKYASLAGAVAAAVAGDTVELLADSCGDGIVIDKDLTVDFGGFTYTVTGSLVGSTGTETIAFQLLSGDIVLKDGTIASGEACTGKGGAYTGRAKMMVQNYADLTLEGMVVDGSTMNPANHYVVSNNSGTVVVDGTTIKVNDPAADFAFDSCEYGSYAAPSVSVAGASIVYGNVELTGGAVSWASGTLSGSFCEGEGFEAGDLSVSGGAFSAPLKASWCAAGLAPYALDGGYVVGAAPVSGDLNANGRVNIVDAQIALDLGNGVYGASFESFPFPESWYSETARAAGDVNGDGAVDALDARAIQVCAHTGSLA